MLYYYPQRYANYRTAIEDDRFFLMRWMRRRKLVRRRRVIERYSDSHKGRIMDVGCSTGLFLHQMARSGWEVVGVEPVTAAAEYTQQRFGLEVFNGWFQDVSYPPASFDVITFWDVLEHTFSPTETLHLAATLLRSGGYIFASVPNWDSFNRRIFGQYWQGLDAPRHLYVLTRETLSAMLQRAGFKVMDWLCFMPGYFSTVMSVTRWLKARHSRPAALFLKVASLPGMRFPFEPWFMLCNWLNKAPTITVVARKGRS
jgi:SAM-dependent methyltransferase